MSDFARQQEVFQRAILDGDDQVLAEILDSPKERRDTLFGVYRNAYALRLIEVLRNDYELLHSYLGDEMFDEMARGYVAAGPSRTPNMRWYSQGLPAFLETAEPFSDHPVLAEIAALEKALANAFDAPDGPILAITDLATIPPEEWEHLTFKPHASAHRFDVATNASAIWSALKDEEMPPDAEEAPERLIVWRHDAMPMFRPFSAEEAMMWDEACQDIPFGVLCAMLATYDDPDNAAMRAAGYLQGWVQAGMLSGVGSSDATRFRSGAVGNRDPDAANGEGNEPPVQPHDAADRS